MQTCTSHPRMPDPPDDGVDAPGPQAHLHCPGWEEICKVLRAHGSRHADITPKLLAVFQTHEHHAINCL